MTGGQASPLTREVVGPLTRSQGLLTVTVPGEAGEHSEEEWYPPTPPIYDVTDKLREINARDFGSASSPEVDHVCAAVRWKEQIVEVQYIESLDRARLATNFNASPPFLKCAALPSPASQIQPQSRLVTERVLELDELSVVGPKPVRISPVMEEESESDTASEVSELPTDEEEEEGKEKVKMFDPEEKDNLSEGELGNEESDNLVTVSKEDHSSDKEDVSESTNSEDSVREIRVKVDVEREDSCNEDLVEDVLVAEEEEQGEEDPSLIEAVSEVEEEEKCLESSSSSSYSSSTSSYASSTPSISPANLPHTSSPENLSDATVPKQQLEDVNLEEDVSEVLDTIKDIVPKVRQRTQDRRSVRKASLEDSGFESFQQSSVELEQEDEKLEDEDENDVIFMPGGAMELSQRMTAEELRANDVLERAERARAVARACRQENRQLAERKVTLQRDRSVTCSGEEVRGGVGGGAVRRAGQPSSEPLDLRQLVEEVRLGRRDGEEGRRREGGLEEEEDTRPLAARAVSRWRARKREEGRLARRVATLSRQRGRGGRRQ